METRNVLRSLVVLILVVVTHQGAQGGEKVFRLKNGRTLTAEIVEESRDAYVVKTKGGGTSTLRKDGVRVVEDPVVKPEAAQTSPVATSQPAASRVVRLASASEVAAARRSLVSYTALVAGAGRTARGRALVAAHGLAPFVTLLLERTDASAKELDAALEIVVADKAAAAPFVNEAAGVLDPKKEMPRSLRLALEAVVEELAR